MTGLVLAWIVSAALVAAPPLQDSRLRRFHLRSGDYIEGRVYREWPNEIEIRLPDGMVLIPRHQVSRIETVKVKTFDAGMKVPAKGGPKSPAKTKTSKVIVPAARGSQTVRQRVENALEAALQGRIERDEAVKRIVEGGDEAALLLASNLERFDPESRALASQVLSIAACEKTAPALKSLLRNADPEIRALAATHLGLLGIKDSWDSVQVLLKDKVGFVRAAAADALSLIDEPAAFQFVAPLCGDPDPLARAAGLRATIGLALKHELRESLMWALERALAWPAKGAEIDIVQALGTSGFQDAWTLAAPRLASPSEALRAAAATALGSLEAKEAIPAILEQMGIEQQAAPRIQLAMAAERINIRAAVPALIEWLSDPSPDDSVRRAALRALRTLTAQRLGESPEEWRAWWEGRTEESGMKNKE